MDLLDTPLGDEIRKVIDAGQGANGVYIDAVIHTNYGDIPALRVYNHDIVREYSHQFADEASILLSIPRGKYDYRVATSRNELEVTVTQNNVPVNGSSGPTEDPLGIHRYRAILTINDNPTMESNYKEALDEDTLDLLEPVTIKLQLIGKAIEQLTAMPVGSIMRRSRVEDVIKYLLIEYPKTLQLSEEYSPLGISMVPSQDTTLREHYPITQGITITDAPGFVHRYCGGVYSAGFSYYYQDDYWYVYPTYDYKRFQQADRQLVILQVPATKMPGSECTYMTEGSVVTIMATGETLFDDHSDLYKRSNGNGLRFADASKLLDVGGETKDNKLLLSRGKLNNEFISSPQKSGINVLRVTEDRITSNIMFQAGILAAREGVYIQIAWQNADPSLIIPGMQTKIQYFKNGEVKEIYAVVLGVQSSIQYTGTGTVSGRYTRTVGLQLFAANDVQQIASA